MFGHSYKRCYDGDTGVAIKALVRLYQVWGTPGRLEKDKQRPEA